MKILNFWKKKRALSILKGSMNTKNDVVHLKKTSILDKKSLMHSVVLYGHLFGGSPVLQVVLVTLAITCAACWLVVE